MRRIGARRKDSRPMSQESVSPPSTDLVPRKADHRRVRLPVLRAEGGDHGAIFYFLQTVFQAPSRADFQASLEDPFYEPSDRLLLRRQRRAGGLGVEAEPARRLGGAELRREHGRPQAAGGARGVAVTGNIEIKDAGPQALLLQVGGYGAGPEGRKIRVPDGAENQRDIRRGAGEPAAQQMH